VLKLTDNMMRKSKEKEKRPADPPSPPEEIPFTQLSPEQLARSLHSHLSQQHSRPSDFAIESQILGCFLPNFLSHFVPTPANSL
jgi:hypothetical protein